MRLDASAQGETSRLSPQNPPQPQTAVTMGAVHSYDLSSREQLRQTQTKESVQQMSSNACVQNVQVRVLLLSDSSKFRMRMRYLARSYYVLGLILRLQGHISGHWHHKYFVASQMSLFVRPNC